MHQKTPSGVHLFSGLPPDFLGELKFDSRHILSSELVPFSDYSSSLNSVEFAHPPTYALYFSIVPAEHSQVGV